MSTDVGQAALDGTTTDGDVLAWRPVVLNRRVTDSRQRATARTAGPKPGDEWSTTSTLDECTVAAEDQVVYVDPNGLDWTPNDMLIEVFKALKGFK